MMAPLPGGRFDGNQQAPSASSEETSSDTAAELEAARQEAARAKRERDEAVDAMADMIREVEGQ